MITDSTTSVIKMQKGKGEKQKMKKGRNGLVIGLSILVVAAAFVTFTPLALAVPTATNIGVDDANGYTDTHVLVPVNITNVQDGPVPSLIFDILYDNSVINVSDVQKGALTLNWQTPAYCNHEWGTRVAIVYDSEDVHAIQNGATGSVVVLNFSVIDELGDTSVMDLSNIQLAEGAPDYQIGTAPAKNGTFTVQLGDVTPGKVTGLITTIKGTVMEGVTVTLTANDSSEVLETATTNGTGYFNLTTVETAEYYVNCTKLRYWDDSSLVTVQSGDTKTVNAVLSRKGDLNDNGRSADAGDVTMMLRASVYKLTPDREYNLNNNGRLADAGDVTMMLRASVYKMELL
jgi:hypothetical protein